MDMPEDLLSADRSLDSDPCSRLSHLVFLASGYHVK